MYKRYGKGSFTLAFFVVFLCCQLIALSPQAHEFYHRARAAYEEGNLLSARNNIHRARNLQPNSHKLAELASRIEFAIEEEQERLLRRGEFFYESRRIPEARSIFERLLELNPDNDFAVERLQSLNEETREIVKMRASGIRVDSSTGRSHDLGLYSTISYMQRARALYANGRYENAKEMLQTILAREPEYPPAIELLDKIEDILRLQRYLEKVESSFDRRQMLDNLYAIDKLIEQMPDRFEFLLMRAQANMYLRNYKEAINDLNRYYNNVPNQADVVFPLLSEAWLAKKNFAKALAYSRAPDGKYYKSFGYRFNCYYNMHKGSFIIIIALLIFLMVVSWKLLSIYIELTSRISPVILKHILYCLYCFKYDKAESCVSQLSIIARSLNHPWFYYLAGLVYLKAGDAEKAQSFLKNSINDKAIAFKAQYFYNLSRKEAKYTINDSNYEESVVNAIDRKTEGWHPSFLKKLEADLTDKYSSNISKDSFEYMVRSMVRVCSGETEV